MENTLQITSTAFENAHKMPSKYTCDGENLNPPMKISGIPAGAVSLAVIMDDPDATIGVWDHWVIFDISSAEFPNGELEISEGHEPAGLAGKGTSGNLDYFGPCPPDGEHRYVFKVYALDCMLGLPEGATKEQVEKAMEGHILAENSLIGLYSREK